MSLESDWNRNQEFNLKYSKFWKHTAPNTLRQVIKKISSDKENSNYLKKNIKI